MASVLGRLTIACYNSFTATGRSPEEDSGDQGQWAGHSVAVLKKIYAKCLVGEEDRAKRQIEEALRRS
jgi:hypothetical protein